MMYYPRHAVILPMPRRYFTVLPTNPYAGARIDASVVPGTIAHSIVPGNVSHHGITGRPSGTILGGPTVVRPAPAGRTIVPTVIPTPAALRNSTVAPSPNVRRPQTVVPGPRQPAVKHRRHARALPGPVMPVGRGYNLGLPPRRR